jgi:probable HAF family extracellular repeat protein
MCKRIKFIAALAIFVSIQFTQAQAQQSKFPHYRIVDLGTLGGSAAIANTINDLGIASGTANVTGDTASHATAWFYGLKQDLGTLGGPNSTVAWPNRNNHGVIAGISELAGTDKMNENFSCPAFFPVDGHSCVAFVWQWGNMTQLPLLGGNNSIGAGINNRDQIVGWAETNVHDSTCVFPQIFQFEAVIWGPATGQIRQLPPYGKDPDSAATAINDQGQVVGISGTCDVAIGAYSAIHAVLWDHGKPFDLGNLGGAGWNTPTVINNLGQVGGFADVPGDVVGGTLTPNFQAFLWTRELGMINLHTLHGDAISEVTGMNNRTQIVGTSFAAGFANPRAFYWQNGKIVDLNSLVPANSSLHLISTGDINDEGVIAAQACFLTNGSCGSATTAVLLIPTDNDDDREFNSIGAVSMPESVRQQVLSNLRIGGFAAHK